MADDKDRPTDSSSGDNIPETALDRLIGCMDDGRAKHAEVTNEFGRSADRLRAVSRSWQELCRADPERPVVRAGEMFYIAAADELGARVMEVEPQLDALCRTIGQVEVGSLSATASTTGVLLSDDFPEWLQAVPVDLPSGPDPELSERLRQVGDWLPDVYSSAFETLRITNADPGRACMLQTRELLRQFFAALAPDDEVRKSEHWKEKEAPDKNAIHQAERVAYVGHRYIQDEHRRRTLLEAERHPRVIYKELNKAHRHGDVDRERALSLLAEVETVLAQWLDAMHTGD